MATSTLNTVDFLIISGVPLGLILGIILLLIKGKNNRANQFLGLLVLAFMLYMLTGFFARFGLLENFPHIIRTHLILGYLIGPLIYFYVQSSTTEAFCFRPIHFVHLIPFAFDLVYNIPFFLQSGAEKLAFYLNARSGDIDLSFDIPILTKVLHAFIYFGVSVYAIFQYKRHLENSVSSIDNDFHRWLLFFSTALLIPLFAILLFVFSGYQFSSQLFVVGGFYIFLIAVLLASMLKPALFHSFPNPIPQVETTVAEKTKYQSSTLKEAQKERYVNKLLTYFEEEKPYQEPELTLVDLAKRLKIAPNYLSQIINEKLEQKFLDFINKYRVSEAKELLADDKKSHLTILSIAYEVGFNSKTAFYTAFKKFAGSSPTEYRKSLNKTV